MSFLNPKSPERCHTSRVGGPWFVTQERGVKQIPTQDASGK